MLKKYLRWVLFLCVANTSWAEDMLIYYTFDPMASMQNIQTRLIPIDMTVQKFLDTLQPPLPPLDAHTIWTLATTDHTRVTPSDLVVSNGQTGKSVSNPWVITKVAVG